ncbi:hypothetical protein HPB47_026852 [Ixodes persulcatus]|uniref:Uncharacterized protein n=1 Tax=Ixodes persulcatus TaxID=34615 RepID=A0AC60PY36_IXOPE|nr:hypothetical protein HPB47_026852 [Ixodes persulcatus]
MLWGSVRPRPPGVPSFPHFLAPFARSSRALPRPSGPSPAHPDPWTGMRPSGIVRGPGRGGHVLGGGEDTKREAGQGGLSSETADWTVRVAVTTGTTTRTTRTTEADHRGRARHVPIGRRLGSDPHNLAPTWEPDRLAVAFAPP